MAQDRQLGGWWWCCCVCVPCHVPVVRSSGHQGNAALFCFEEVIQHTEIDTDRQTDTNDI